MLRDKNLIPLSHQHQHALALCVRIDRGLSADETEVAAWCDEVAKIWSDEISVHFQAEEDVLFPEAKKYADLSLLVGELLAEHQSLRECFSRASAHRLNAPGLRTMAAELSAHIRKEERLLFEECQRLMSPERLRELGAKLEQALSAAVHQCSLPNPALNAKSKIKKSP